MISPQDEHGRGTAPVAVGWWQPVLFGAMAGGMGWGIRGQYGHETGAMIAGLLVSLTLVLLLAPGARALPAARAVAWGAIAIGFGGCMTYGQTLGLTHDGALTGNLESLRWGMLGLAIKGGAWIGFGGVFLGMGLGGVRYRPRQLLAIMAGMGVLFIAGVWLFNLPFDPEHRRLPWLYFSADWRWRPDAIDLRPRREVWGGLWLALLGLIAFTRWVRRDTLAARLGGWGILGGALGFPAGQTLQALHAWHPEYFHQGLLAPLAPHINWWNLMETTFGAVWGGVLGLGVWLNRSRIRWPETDPGDVPLPTGVEWYLLAIHAGLVTAGEFLTWSVSDVYVEYSFLLGLIPVVAVAGGRWWPWLLMLPVTLLPIAGKTISHLAYEARAIAPVNGWLVYGVFPMLVATAAVFWCMNRMEPGGRADRILAAVLGLTTWTYFGLNFAFFRFPWPWQPWTTRTPHALVYLACALGLSAAVWLADQRRKAGPADETG
ncbi:MAG: hypothetical protein H7A45_19225 [Verrucomicrobiales bacterium]|nr:hypothetical protein [Verrucomicrobiales bacterium]MCP5526954.1 hypothetical protein [Verrucomicrobiales bacterium]